MDYQLIVIGAGPGGYEAALHAAGLGVRTAVIEKNEVGGTCLNRGCVPTKALLHAADVYRKAVEGGRMGICFDGAGVDMQKLSAYKEDVTLTLRAGIETMFKNAGVELLRGKGRIQDAHTVSVEDASGGRTTVTGDHILIATGSVPMMPPIPGLDLEGVLTSNDLLDKEIVPYKSIIIIGGGVIGVEFAQFFSDMGTEVTIVEGLNRLLPQSDREFGQNLSMLLKKKNVRIFTGSMVQSVEACADGMRVNFEVKEKIESATAQVVLCAIGRAPYTDGLFADGFGVEMDHRRIRVDENFRTSVPGIYAIGDVSSAIQLAHVATAQGIRAVDLMFGRENRVEPDTVPSCIYCRPEIASVGLTEAQAKEKGIAVKVGKAVLGGNARTLITDPGRSFMKIVARADNGQIIGGQLMCEHSTDMISQISLAIANHLSAADMLRYMRPHPTFEEALTDALQKIAGQGG